MHGKDCPKCGTAIADGTKTCSSCSATCPV
ncbi:hypothetical protein HMPREF1624_03375 [Sporothrix schenckii ATCC 58251]|uniref:Zinc-ribbon domain-containing protein n=1 Tax=Sporothrix schenckii (strain ATCC 58251 / de Perez 2211183) TaxID=1391915 RepID=U7PZW9_SPOS1|nr:hypothetical protein HMPREF1624_03375 [Sporothrix schenckii ATCC 58251]